ncbi:hypothetical protein IT575_08565 [bacterium]|nr:hypothetical protein [bacterium]
MEISVYGAAGCPRMAMVTEFISAGGGLVKQWDIETDLPSDAALARLLAFENAFLNESGPVDSPLESGTIQPVQEADKLRALLSSQPSALSVPLAVRGSRVILASSPDRIQSLMY